MIIRTEPDLEAVIAQIRDKEYYSFDTETLDYGFPDTSIVGVSLGWGRNNGVYIPIGHGSGEGQLPKEVVAKHLRPLLESDKLCIMHNARYDIKVAMLEFGVKGIPHFYDTMIAFWLIDGDQALSLSALAQKYLNYTMVELEDIAPSEKHPYLPRKRVLRTDLVEIDVMSKYAIDDATKPIALWEISRQLIVEKGYEKLFYELELPFVRILTRMEWEGVQVDKARLEEAAKEAPKKLDALLEKIFAFRESKEPFNLNSQAEMNKVLFEELGLKPIGPKGKNGYYSTKEEYLREWAKDHAIAELILEYRSLSKLYGTYLLGFLNHLQDRERLHTNFTSHVTATGRLSSNSPNLQNVPRPENDVFGIRSFFVAPEGKLLIAADYSQIELRVLAHVSRDPVLTQAFINGDDIHSTTAKALFNLPEPVEEVKNKHPEKRALAKTFNFAMVYEAGVKTMAQQAKVSEDTARQLRAKYFREFKGIENYMNWTHAYAEKHGYIKTLLGRTRALPDAQLPGRTSDENMRKSAAFRRAMNTPIQGSAADIMKIAMRNIQYRLEREGLAERAKMILQVHDEILLEADEEIAEEVAAMVKEEMENAVTLRVPLVADVGIGKDWMNLKDL